MVNAAETGSGWADAEEIGEGNRPELPTNGHVGATAGVPGSQWPQVALECAAQARVFPCALVACAVAAQQLGYCPEIRSVAVYRDPTPKRI